MRFWFLYSLGVLLVIAIVITTAMIGTSWMSVKASWLVAIVPMMTVFLGRYYYLLRDFSHHMRVVYENECEIVLLKRDLAFETLGYAGLAAAFTLFLVKVVSIYRG